MSGEQDAEMNQDGRVACPQCRAELDKFCKPDPGSVLRPGEFCMYCGLIWQLETKGSDEERACILCNDAMAACPPGPAEIDRLLGYIACSSDTEAVKVRAGVLARAVIDQLQPLPGAPAQKGSSRS